MSAPRSRPVPAAAVFFMLVIILSGSAGAKTCNDLCIERSYAGGACDKDTSVDSGCNDVSGKQMCAYKWGTFTPGTGNNADDCPLASAQTMCICWTMNECAPNCLSRCVIDSGCAENTKTTENDPGGLCNQYCAGKSYQGGECRTSTAVRAIWAGGKCYYGPADAYCGQVGCKCDSGTGEGSGSCWCRNVQDCPDIGNSAGRTRCDANAGCIAAPVTSSSSSTSSTTLSSDLVTSWDLSGVLNEIKNAVYTVLMTLYCLVLFIASGVAALFIIFTGLKYMTSDDAAGRVEARKRLVYSLAGLMFVALACPLINMLFSGTNIGVDDGTGHKTPCPGCPLIGELTTSSGGFGGFGGWFTGGDTQGSWFTDARLKQAKTFQVCTTPADCPSGRVCASNGEKTGGTSGDDVYRCFPKIADGYSISNTGLTPLSGDNADLCNSGYVSGDKCARNLKCQNRNGCSSGEYCGIDAYCKTKKGVSDACSAGIMLGDTNPDYVCQSNWCVGGTCMDAGNCAGPDDCNRHYSGAFCNGNYLCEWKRYEKAECKASQITGGTANDICRSGNCKSNDQCA